MSILDVRPYNAYLEGHIPEAVHLSPGVLGLSKGDDGSEAPCVPCIDPSIYIPLLEARGVDGARATVVSHF